MTSRARHALAALGDNVLVAVSWPLRKRYVSSSSSAAAAGDKGFEIDMGTLRGMFGHDTSGEAMRF